MKNKLVKKGLVFDNILSFWRYVKKNRALYLSAFRTINNTVFLKIDLVKNHIRDINIIYSAQEAGMEVFSGIICDASVLPSTDVIFKKDEKLALDDMHIYYQKIIDQSKDDTYYPFRIKGRCGYLFFHNGKKCHHKQIRLEKAMFAGSMGVDNLFHLTFDILPAFILANRYSQYDDYPLLISDRLKQYPTLVELLEITNTKRKPVIWMSYDEMCCVEKLLYVSKMNYRPFKIMAYANNKLVLRYMCPRIVDIIRSIIYIEPDNKLPKNIFLSRGHQKNKRLTNWKEVEGFFVENDFEIIYPEELSMADQIRIMRSAEFVVGITGAAMTNIVYCDSGTKILLMEDFKFYYNIARLVVKKCEYIEIHNEICNYNSSNSMFSVDLEELEEKYEFLKAM